MMVGLVGFMVLSATFNNISVLLVEEPEYPEKTTGLPQVTVLGNGYSNILDINILTKYIRRNIHVRSIKLPVTETVCVNF
jgi:hypothetical protein